MRRHRVTSDLRLFLLLSIVAACSDATAPIESSETGLTPEAPWFAITDARDDAGLEHFYFLEPVDRRPKRRSLGAPDRTLTPHLAVEICRWTSSGCAQPLLARYTSTSGVGKERLQFMENSDSYRVRWYTERFENVEPGQTYRVTVLAAGVPLGSADVTILRRWRDWWRLNRKEYVGLVEDEGLPIRFYIEKCGVFVLPAAGGAATPCASGSLIATKDEGIGLLVPEGAVKSGTKLSIQRLTDGAADLSVASGPYAFGPQGKAFAKTLTLSLGYPASRVPNDLPETSLQPYRMSGGSWQPAAGGSSDAVGNRVSLSISQFGEYALLAAVASIALTVPAEPMASDGTAVATATIEDAAGRELGQRKMEWSVSPAGIVDVDANGKLTARTEGQATLSVSSEGKSASAIVTVRAAVVAVHSVTIGDAGTTPLDIGGTRQLSAVAYDKDQKPLSGRIVTWSSSDATIASIDDKGLVAANAPGEVTITALVEGVKGTATLAVRAAVSSVEITAGGTGSLNVDATRQLSAIPFDASRNPLSGRAATWSSSDNSIATVDPTGVVRAKKAGDVTITALVEGVSATIAIRLRGLLFGPYHLDHNLFAAPFAGALRELKPDASGLAMLEAARRAGFQIIVRPVRGSARFEDPVTGRFRLDLWKLELDRFRGMDFSAYIQDGTIIGIYLMDEPMDPSNWTKGCVMDPATMVCLRDANGAIIEDKGEVVSFADIDASAEYAKQLFPGVPMGVGSRPTQLEPGAPFQHLNFALAQYSLRRVVGPAEFAATEIAVAKRIGLGVQLSINAMGGNGGLPVTASQLRSWGMELAREPYACALTMWKWESTDSSPTEPYNSFWVDAANVAALQDVADVAGKRPPAPCRLH